jgi:hypothetical protein
MTRHASLIALAAAGAIGCASAPRPATAPDAGPDAPAATSPAPTVTPVAPAVPESALRFVVTPAEAEIAIDGNPAGRVADLGGQGGLLSLAPGIYQVSLKATGYVTWRAEVALRAGTETIRVTLAKKP